MLPGDAPQFLNRHAGPAEASASFDKPRKPRPTGGPEGPWWRRPVARRE